MKTLVLAFLFAEVVIGDVLYDYLQSNLLFTQDYYEEFSTRDASNFEFSPASIQAALGMVALGGEGETQNQLSDLAHFHFNMSKIADLYVKLGKRLSAMQTSLQTSFMIYLANATLNTPYRSSVEDVFKANISIHPFPKMNTLSLAETYFVLSNGIIFLYRFSLPDEWKTMFYNGPRLRYNTSKVDFELIATLHIVRKLNYHRNDVLRAKFLEIPITDNETTLTIVLPYKTNRLSIVERHIPEILRSQRYQEMNVLVTIPKYWKHNFENLVSYFKSLDMSIPFSEEAEFTKATKSHTQINSVIHKTIVTLSKVPTDYSTPSVVPVEFLEHDSVNPIQTNFTVDRPFLYYIKHSVLGVIVIGRYIKP